MNNDSQTTKFFITNILLQLFKMDPGWVDLIIFPHFLGSAQPMCPRWSVRPTTKWFLEWFVREVWSKKILGGYVYAN
jgi:hypothetical protein